MRTSESSSRSTTRIFGTEGRTLQRLLFLPFPPTPTATQSVQRQVAGSDPAPRGCMARRVRLREAPLGGNQRFLRHILGEMDVPHDAKCDPHYDRVLRPGRTPRSYPEQRSLRDARQKA